VEATGQTLNSTESVFEFMLLLPVESLAGRCGDPVLISSAYRSWCLLMKLNQYAKLRSLDWPQSASVE